MFTPERLFSVRLTVLAGSDLTALLAQTLPDMVFDLAVPAALTRMVRQALAAGAHVLSENPMANSLKEARGLLDAIAQASRLHPVMKNRRFLPGIRRVKALLGAGASGHLTAVHIDFFIGAHFGGLRDQMQHVLLLDMAIHTCNAVRFVSGCQSGGVYCHKSNPAGSWYAHGASADALFDLARGVTMTYRGSWYALVASTAWEAQWRLIGSMGTILWDGNEGVGGHPVAGDDGFFRPLTPLVVPPLTDPLIQGHSRVIADFLNAVETGQPALTDGRGKIHSLAMVFAAIASAEAGQRLPVTTGVPHV